MKLTDVRINSFFICNHRRWRVTDVGSRVVVAVPERDGWMNGPPFAIAEHVFDENDLPACRLVIA